MIISFCPKPFDGCHFLNKLKTPSFTHVLGQEFHFIFLCAVRGREREIADWAATDTAGWATETAENDRESAGCETDKAIAIAG